MRVLDQLSVDGDITADSFIKDGASSDDVLLGDGSTTSLSGISGGGGSLWTADTNGIKYTSGNVGIGTSSDNTSDLTVGSGGMIVNGAVKFDSDLRLVGYLQVSNGTGSWGQVLTRGLNGISWATPSTGGGVLTIGSNATEVFSASASTLSAVDAGANKLMYWDNDNDKLDYLEIGNNLSISSGKLNASGSGGTTQDLFDSIAVQGQTTITADSANTVLKVGAGAGISLATDNTTKTLTITSTATGGGGGDITAVNAGSGMSGGGTTGDVTINASLGNGMALNGSNEIIPDGSIVRTNKSNNFGSSYYQRFSGAIRDAGNSAGNSGQTLQSTGTNVDWVNAGTWLNSGGTNYLSGTDKKIVTNGLVANAWLHIRKMTASTSTPTVMLEAPTSGQSNDNFITFRGGTSTSHYWSTGVDSNLNEFKIGYTTNGASPFAPATYVKFKITSSGNATFLGTSTADNFILSSDKRLKENVKDVDYDQHIRADWKTFNLKKDSEEKRYGVIAQELEVNHPEFVNTDKEGYKSVKYIDLLIAKIAELEARLEKLEK